MSVDSDVGVRVAALCLDRKGRLSERLLCSTAVRAGLLVDLALTGRLVEVDDGIELDDSPTGRLPTDLLLREITARPGTTLDTWLERRHPGLRDLAEDAVRTGRWRVRRGLHAGLRFTDERVEQTAVDRARDPDAGTDGWSPPDAAVTAIALTAGLLSRPGPAERPGEELLTAAGAQRWLVAAVTEHLAWARERDAVTASLTRSSLNAGYVGGL
jgi:hypothetical protein